jgi:AraC-like DNA-binding protein/DNA-binding NarL/FixJ family response regulator
MNTFSSYTRENRKLNTNNVTSLFYNKDGKSNNLFIGTAEGLVILNLSSTERQVLTGNSNNIIPFTNNYITQVLQDSRGLIWIGTREGLNILDLETDNLQYLTVKEGLCNNNVCGIAEDKNHNMWITTSGGVSRVVTQRNHEDGTYNFGLYNYSTTDGLQSNEFNLGSIITKADGNVLLGGLYGINWVLQKTKDDNESLPRVMLTQLYIGEEEVQVGHTYGGKVILGQAINEMSKIELAHDQNTFTIRFGAGNYNQSERLQFKYWMEGLDDDWKNGNALTHGVTFTDLSSGSYTLHVKAISAERAVSTQERTLEIHIERHWLLSWWMIIAYILILATIIYFWKIGRKQIKAIRSRKNAIISELIRQREEIKAASEDLRQPMARMTSIIGNLSEQKKTLEEREQLNALHSQMLQIITRVSDMQTNLEHPEEKAKNVVHDRLEMNGKGEIQLPDLGGETLTSEITRSRAALDAPTMKFSVVMIDDNIDFLTFATSRLKYVYAFHAYDDIEKAADDLMEMRPDLVVCKQDMPSMTGSDLCNQLKMNVGTQNTKFVLMTDSVLTPQDMRKQNITLSADDYLAKPFNLQEAVMRFNKILGLGPIEIDSNLIEGAETRMLEDHNASMTTATESYSEMGEVKPEPEEVVKPDDPMSKVETVIIKNQNSTKQGTELAQQIEQVTEEEEVQQDLSDYSMLDVMDQQLMKNIEQYVLQNMSRGQIKLEEMASAMGMGRVPFFHRVRNLTGKTPAELVRDLRLKHACILLKRTNINMSELSTNIGFMTAENFINIFREKFGMTPLEYRLKHRQ